MKPWLKVAIGCIAVSVIACFLLIAGLVAVGYWAKNKVQEVASGGPAVEEARRAANAVPFTRPADSRLDEARLVKFIEVRSDVFSVYEKYRGELESRVKSVKEGKSFDLGDVSTGLTMVSEVHKAEALALARHGMSEAEYAFITEEVYKAMWSASPGADAATRAIQEQVEAATRQAENADLPPEARAALAAARAEMATGAKDAAREMQALAPSSENAALFKKYETDLKRYAMPGLQVLFGAEGSPTPAAPNPKP